MKKILFSLVALVCSMSMNAQIMKVYNGETLVREYNANEATHVVFEEQKGPITTGTVTTTIDGKDVDIKWVQLWEGGPKFADRNVGMTYYDATSRDFRWGSNWRTPSKGELNELMLAASSKGSAKVKCEYVDEGNGYGFKFTGKQEYYTKNTIFLPVQNGTYDGVANYWSSTEDEDDGYRYAWVMYLRNWNGEWLSNWVRGLKYESKLVRPVLR